MDTQFTAYPVCPHCGKIDTDAWEHELDDGDSAEVECDSCEKSYWVVCHITVKYSTMPIEGGE